MKDKPHHYSYYGLKVESFFAFPELTGMEFDKPDVVVCCSQQYENTGEKKKNIGLYVEGEASCLFVLEEKISIRVTSGTSIVVLCSTEHKHQPTWLRPYLLGPVFNALLHQRGILLFHASVVQKSPMCCAIVGQSGAGKSTTAAHLCADEDFQLIADDICALEFTAQHTYRILPSAPRLKLLPDAINRIVSYKDLFDNQPAESPKIAVKLEPQHTHSHTNLTAIFLLQENTEKKLTMIPQKGIKKAQSLLKNVMWTDYLNVLGKREKLFHECMQVAKVTTVYLLSFDKSIHSPRKIAGCIAAEAGSIKHSNE